MDKEQAIDLLDNLIGMIEDNQENDYDTAFRMAIGALKQPEIVTCGECKWYGRANKQRFYRGMDCLQRRMSTIVPDKDFCSRAERRTYEEKQSD